MTKINEKEENQRVIDKTVKCILDDAKTEDDQILRYLFILLMIEAIKGKTHGFANSDIKASIGIRHGRLKTIIIELPDCY